MSPVRVQGPLCWVPTGQQELFTGRLLCMRNRPEAVSGTEGQLRPLGPGGTGPEGLEGHPPPQEKLRRGPGLRACPRNLAGVWRHWMHAQRRRGHRRPLLPDGASISAPALRAGTPAFPPWYRLQQRRRSLCGEITRGRRLSFLTPLCWALKGAGRWWQVSPVSTEWGEGPGGEPVAAVGGPGGTARKDRLEQHVPSLP